MKLILKKDSNQLCERNSLSEQEAITIAEAAQCSVTFGACSAWPYDAPTKTWTRGVYTMQIVAE
jgi:hypothetical protein